MSVHGRVSPSPAQAVSTYNKPAAAYVTMKASVVWSFVSRLLNDHTRSQYTSVCSVTGPRKEDSERKVQLRRSERDKSRLGWGEGKCEGMCQHRQLGVGLLQAVPLRDPDVRLGIVGFLLLCVCSGIYPHSDGLLS